MEVPMKVVVVMVLLLIATIVLASLIIGWNQNAKSWFELAFEEFSKMVLGG
jgi:hypothetical protein